MQDEGFRNKVYKDTLGNLTVGYGHKLTNADLKKYKLGDTLSTEDLNRIYKQDYSTARKFAESYAPKNAPPEVVDILSNMSFQMGAGGVKGFEKMKTALDKGDYKTAAAEMRNSEWYKQTPERTERLASRMEGIGMDNKNKKVTKGALDPLGLPDSGNYKELPTTRDKTHGVLGDLKEAGSKAWDYLSKPFVSKEQSVPAPITETGKQLDNLARGVKPVTDFMGRGANYAETAFKRGLLEGAERISGRRNMLTGELEKAASPMENVLMQDQTGEISQMLAKYNDAASVKDSETVQSYVPLMQNGKVGRAAAWDHYQQLKREGKFSPADMEKIEKDFLEWKDSDTNPVKGPVDEDPSVKLARERNTNLLKGESEQPTKSPQELFDEELNKGALDPKAMASQELWENFNQPKVWYESDAFLESVVRFGVGLAGGQSMDEAYDSASKVYDSSRGQERRNLMVEDLRTQGYTEASIRQWVQSNDVSDLSMGTAQYSQNRDKAGNIWQTDNATGKAEMIHAAPEVSPGFSVGNNKYSYTPFNDIKKDDRTLIRQANTALKNTIRLPALFQQIPALNEKSEDASRLQKLWNTKVITDAIQPGNSLMNSLQQYDLTDDPELKAFMGVAGAALDPLLRIASGAVLTNPEIASSIASNIPSPWDSEHERATKMQTLATILMETKASTVDEDGAKYQLMADVQSETQWIPVIGRKGIELYDPERDEFWDEDELVKKYSNQ